MKRLEINLRLTPVGKCIQALYDDQNDEVYIEAKGLENIISLEQIVGIAAHFSSTAIGDVPLMESDGILYIDISWIHSLGIIANNKLFIRLERSIRQESTSLIKAESNGCQHGEECIFTLQNDRFNDRFIKLCLCSNCPVWNMEELEIIPDNDKARKRTIPLDSIIKRANGYRRR